MGCSGSQELSVLLQKSCQVLITELKLMRIKMINHDSASVRAHYSQHSGVPNDPPTRRRRIRRMFFINSELRGA